MKIEKPRAGSDELQAISESSSTAAAGRSSPDAPIQSPNSAIHFTDITLQSGIDIIMTCGKLPSSEILEVNGGGLALIDYDNDGDLDLFVANGATLDDPEHGSGCRLYENAGDSSIRFKDVTDQAGISIHRWATGVAVGDYDGDGFDDIYVCCYGSNILLHNTGAGRFVDVTSTAFGNSQSSSSQAANSPSIPEWSTSAAFGDVDGDGDLDLYVCRYLDFDVNHPPTHARYKDIEVMAGPHGLKAQYDVLFENHGDGTFRDISSISGCRPPAPAFGLNVVILDFDDDGRHDIVVANDSMPDFFFHNLGPVDGHARFEEIGIMSGIASNHDGTNQASMGIAVADVNGDGLPDKFCTVFSSDTNSLHVNLTARHSATSRPQGITADLRDASMPLFEDRAQQYGLAMISRPYLGWSCGFFDFDLDGNEDLFMVNGHVYPQATMQTMDSEYEQTPLLFERQGKRFQRVQHSLAGEWLAQRHRDRNAVFGDLDGDGDIDIVIGELNGRVRVLRNDLIANDERWPNHDSQSPGRPPIANWLIVNLLDQRAVTRNHRGLGSKIVLTSNAPTTPITQTRWIYNGGGFQSSGAPCAHFGLRPDIKSISLTITWPDRIVQRVADVQTRQRITVTRSE